MQDMVIWKFFGVCFFDLVGIVGILRVYFFFVDDVGFIFVKIFYCSIGVLVYVFECLLIVEEGLQMFQE